MNLRRVLGLGLFTFLMCFAVAASCQPANPPQTYVKVPATITLGDLSPQQLQDRAEELTTTTTTVRQPSTTVAYVDPLTKCQEWLPVAVSVGWPNDTETLEKLGRLIWKETRCLNIGYLHPSFNGHDHGLVQANILHRAWVEKLFDMPFEESMSDPTLNLRFGWLLYETTKESHGCGWRPWKMC